MHFPVVDTRAFGWGFVNQPLPKKSLGQPVPFLGVRSSEAINEAAKELEKAKTYVQKVHDSYQDLAAAIGEARANRAYEEAKQGFDLARKNYEDTVEIIGGPR